MKQIILSKQNNRQMFKWETIVEYVHVLIDKWENE